MEMWVPCVMTDLAAQRRETGIPVQLPFDSHFELLPTGMRSAAMNIRQALFRAEPHQIDLQLEEQPERNCLLVTGQLLDVSTSSMVGPDVEITLSNRRADTIKIATNQFGEFRAELEKSGDLELSFVGHNGKTVFILLAEAPKPSSEGKE